MAEAADNSSCMRVCCHALMMRYVSGENISQKDSDSRLSTNRLQGLLCLTELVCNGPQYFCDGVNDGSQRKKKREKVKQK